MSKQIPTILTSGIINDGPTQTNIIKASQQEGGAEYNHIPKNPNQCSNKQARHTLVGTVVKQLHILQVLQKGINSCSNLEYIKKQ